MSTFAVSSLYKWPRHSTLKTREIVMDVVNAAKAPLATRDIYNQVIKPARVGKPAPHPGEDIRSMRYLKTVVLRDLVAQNRVEKVMTKGSGSFTAWLWRPKQSPRATSPAKPTKPPVPAISTSGSLMELTPAAVGVGEDWSHLNKRRQRARKMKVERDLQRMLEVQKMQRKATLER